MSNNNSSADLLRHYLLKIAFKSMADICKNGSGRKELLEMAVDAAEKVLKIRYSPGQAICLQKSGWGTCISNLA